MEAFRFKMVDKRRSTQRVNSLVRDNERSRIGLLPIKLAKHDGLLTRSTFLERNFPFTFAYEAWRIFARSTSLEIFGVFLRNVQFESCFEFDKMVDDIEINSNKKLNAI